MKMPAVFRRDESGASMVEMTLVLPMLLTLLLGFVDFGYAYYQWNAATKAVQIGARMASISTPVAPQISTAGPTAVAGDPVVPGSYAYVCDGATSLCSCTGAGCVAGTFTAANFNRIFYGDDGSCAPVANVRPGMCDFFPRLTPANVVVRYTATGLGYQTRPGGAVPTISVSLQNMTFQFFFIQPLLNLQSNTINMPSMLSTVTGEDMSSVYSP